MLLNNDGEKNHLGQHGVYFEIPKYVYEINKITNCDYSKGLVIPSSSNGYYTYKNWPVTGMPNIFTSFYCINTFDLSREGLEAIKYIKKGEINLLNILTLDELKKIGVKYLINMKDVLESEQPDKTIAYQKILKNLNDYKSLNKIYSNFNIDLYEILDYRPFISVLLNNKIYTSINSSQLAKQFYVDIKEPGKYRIESLFPYDSPLDIYVDNNIGSKSIGVFEEVKMLTSPVHKRNNRDGFINWEVDFTEKGRFIIYNKSSLINYIIIFCSILFIYYIFLYYLLTLNICRKKIEYC
jgi:hypothetical protein